MDVKKTHPDYDSNSADWEFYLRSYMGGNTYVGGEYLTKYIDDIAAEESLSDDKIGETKKQQRDLLSELRVVKGHLDELVKYGEGPETDEDGL